MKKLFFLIVIIFNFKPLYAQNNIVYLDMQFILNNSLAGKMVTEHLEKIKDSKKGEFNKVLASIKTQENDIKSKKNILTDQEYNNQLNLLKKKISIFKKDQNQHLINLNKKKKNYSNQILEKLNPILSDYAKENNISFIISKEYILLAKKDHDITTIILNLLNNELKSINLN